MMLRNPFFLLVLLSFLSFSSSSKKCGKIPRFLHRLRNGVDITKLDLLPTDATEADGFRLPVLDFTCEYEQKQELNGITYDIPDQIWSIVDIPSGWLNSNIKIYKNSYAVKKSMGASLDLDVSDGAFSSSGSYKTMQNFISNSSKYVEEVTSYTSGYKVNMMPDWIIEFGRIAKSYIDRFLPKKFNTETASKYMKFIKHFGTHFFKHGKFGGLLKLVLATDKSYFATKTDNTVRAQAKITFFNIIKHGRGSSSSSQRVDTRFTQATASSVKYFGGSTNLLAAGGISKWQPSVAKSPWLFGGSLTKISNIIHDSQKRNSMKRATMVHLDKAHLQELLRIIGGYYARGNRYRVPGTLEKYQKQINELYGQVIPDHDKVIQMAKTVSESVVPSWFLKVQLCYSWYADGDHGQCGGGASRLLCAKINHMTGYYRDDTDWRGGGCRMRWSIRASWYEDWFRYVKICYRWRPDGDRGQCGGGASRLLCASVNSYTGVYRDDTDRRDGGCRMQWKLSVPSNAPLWMKNARICYEWYPDGDRGQCGGGAPRRLCAKVNSFTREYRDDTDFRGGGCRMRWGVVTS